MLIFLRRNLAWMLLALILSMGLWLIVTIDQNPMESYWFSSIPVEVRDPPAGMALRSEVAPVRVRVSAPRDLWAARALPAEKFRASVDASTAGPGIAELPVVVTSGDSRAKVEEIDPPKAVVRLEPVKRKDVPVRIRLAGSVPLGYEARPAKVTPQEVTVSGPQGLVEQVSHVFAEVSLDGVRDDVSQLLRVVPYAESGALVERVTLSTERVLVEIPIVQQLGYKTVPVLPQVVGTVAFGYQIVGVMVDPATTTVAGDPRALAEMSYLPTRPVDVSGAVGDVAVSVEPALPTGVALARSQTLFARVLISPVEGSKVVDIAPQVKGSGDRQVTIHTGSVQVTISGPMPVLARLRPQDVQVTVDVTGVAAGTHNLKPIISLPSLLKLVSLTPNEVAVTVRQAQSGRTGS